MLGPAASWVAKGSVVMDVLGRLRTALGGRGALAWPAGAACESERSAAPAQTRLRARRRPLREGRGRGHGVATAKSVPSE